MNSIRFPDGTQVPALGQGTWMMAKRPAQRADELAALRAGVELGLTLIDTAEMYADGGPSDWLAKRSAACATRYS